MEGKDCHGTHLAYAGKGINYLVLCCLMLLQGQLKLLSNFEVSLLCSVQAGKEGYWHVDSSSSLLGRAFSE